MDWPAREWRYIDLQGVLVELRGTLRAASEDSPGKICVACGTDRGACMVVGGRHKGRRFCPSCASKALVPIK